MPNIYESDAFSRLQDGSMHPGGLRLTDRAVRLAALKEGARVADIGCGTGATAAFLAGRYQLDVTGLDVSGALIDAGRKKHPGLNLIQSDCETLPFEDGSLDAIFFECTLSVISGNDAAAVRRMTAQCANALKKDGVIIISDVFTARNGPTGVGTANAEVLTEILLASGFSILVQEDHTPALRSFIAELRQQGGDSFDACAFFGTSGEKGLRLSDFSYMLIIARKI